MYRLKDKKDSKKVTVGRTTDTQFISFKSLFDKGKRHLKAYAEFDGLFSGSRKAQRVKYSSHVDLCCCFFLLFKLNKTLLFITIIHVRLFLLRKHVERKKRRKRKIARSSRYSVPLEFCLSVIFLFREHLNFLASVHQLSNIHNLRVSLQLILECNMILGQHP